MCVGCSVVRKDCHNSANIPTVQILVYGLFKYVTYMTSLQLMKNDSL